MAVAWSLWSPIGHFLKHGSLGLLPLFWPIILVAQYKGDTVVIILKLIFLEVNQLGLCSKKKKNQLGLCPKKKKNTNCVNFYEASSLSLGKRDLLDMFSCLRMSNPKLVRIFNKFSK